MRRYCYSGLVALLSTVFSAPALARECSSNDVEVVEYPNPSFPAIASFFGVEGSCEVEFSLYEYGDRIGIDRITCSHPFFCVPSADAVRAATIVVIDVPGSRKPGERRNLVLPISYLFEDSETHDGKLSTEYVCRSSFGKLPSPAEARSDQNRK